jgi:hypothetical protein
MPKHGTIIDIVPQHTCTKELQDLDLKSAQVPTFIVGGESKLIQKLNQLEPPKPLSFDDRDLRDRRPSSIIKDSAAPDSLLKHIRTMKNEPPAHELEDIPDED